MKLGIRRTVAALGALFLATGAVVAVSSTAHALTPAPWPIDTASVADIVFYDASGLVVNGGSIDAAPFATYAQSTKTVRAGDTKATLFGYKPVDGVAPGSWTGEAISASSTFPISTAPPALKASSLPVAKVDAVGGSIGTLVDDIPNTASGDYAGTYQLRLVTSAPGSAAGANYATAAIKVTGNTWERIGNPVIVPTSVSVSVASTAYHGTAVKVTGTALPGAPGKISFKDGSKVVATVTASGGKATWTTSTLSNGTHHLSAVFTPTQTAVYSVSPTSAAKTVKVSVHATKTTIKPSKTSVKKGKKVTLKATVNVSSAKGKIKFYDGKKLLKTVTVKNGKASYAKKFSVGKHKVSAKFVPTHTADFTASTSAKKTVKVKK